MRAPIKSTLLIALTIIIVSCNSTTNEKKSNTEKPIENFDWLLGKWERLHEEAGKETFENWQKISQNEYSGIGFTMQGSDTIKQEKMQITKQHGKWALTVKIPEETQSIIFPITELKSDEFTCTNDSLDFPKNIRYWKNGEKINALVSGDSLKIDFEFERLK